VGEWNSQIIGSRMSNQLIVGYTKQDESRVAIGNALPVRRHPRRARPDLHSFGYRAVHAEQRAALQQLQFQNNFTIYLGNRMTSRFGASFERFESENVFFPGSQSAYVYNSLADFYADANDLLANPNRTTSPSHADRPASLPGALGRTFRARSSRCSRSKSTTSASTCRMSGVSTIACSSPFGVRVDVPQFGETGFVNPQANGRTFRDETGATVQYRTEKLPNASLLWSPRFGFNWDVTGDASTQVRGGTGIFTGRPAYVWISNQIGNNGMLTGFQELISSNEPVRNRPFNPDPDAYKPTPRSRARRRRRTSSRSRTKLPLPAGVALQPRRRPPPPLGAHRYGRVPLQPDVNGVYYINANLPAPTR
jgi:hypothetical protein